MTTVLPVSAGLIDSSGKGATAGQGAGATAKGSTVTRTRKPVPPFATEAEERAYWEREDSAADLDWTKAEPVRLPNLQPSTTAISLRLPVSLLEQIKIAAHKRDVPYQSLIKMWLAEKVG